MARSRVPEGGRARPGVSCQQQFLRLCQRIKPENFFAFGFQQELKSALDEPMREMRETAEAFKNAATFDLPKFDFKPNASNDLQPDPQASPPAIAVCAT